MRVQLLPLAYEELAEALAWYRARSPKAAEGLWLKVMEARKRIALFPFVAPEALPNIRRHLLGGYPYDIIYALRDREIMILAVAHHSRRPQYWQSRVQHMH